jgi:hypothetical protein
MGSALASSSWVSAWCWGSAHKASRRWLDARLRVGEPSSGNGPAAGSNTQPSIGAGRSNAGTTQCASIALDQIGFDQIAVALDRELRRGRYGPRRAKARLALFIGRHHDAKAAKIFERHLGQTARCDREPDGKMRRRWAVGPEAEALSPQLNDRPAASDSAAAVN